MWFPRHRILNRDDSDGACGLNSNFVSAENSINAALIQRNGGVLRDCISR